MNRRFGTERLVEKQDLFILQIQQGLENHLQFRTFL